MADNQLKIIDIGDPYATESFPIKDSFVALDTSAIIKIASPSKTISDFIKLLVINNNTLVIPFKAYEELRILCDSEPEKKPIIVTYQTRDSEYVNASITANGIIAKVEETGILFEEIVDLNPITKINTIDQLGGKIPMRWPDLSLVATVIEHGIPYIWSFDSDFGLVGGSGLTLITDSHIYTKITQNGISCTKIT